MSAISRIRRVIETGRSVLSHSFPGSKAYWERRYASGDDSGAGSSGTSRQFKASVINKFVAEQHIGSVIEFGCGDGNQLSLAVYPSYLGFDVSMTAISWCKERFAADTTKCFGLMDEYRGEKADLALSLDVIYHLVEDNVFDQYMVTLFGASDRYVIIYSTNGDHTPWYTGRHIRRRRFTDWIKVNEPGWRNVRIVPGHDADFYVYEKVHP